MNDSLKKHALRLAILASLPGSQAAIAGEVTFDGTLAPAGGRAAGSLPATNGTYTINQSDGVTRGGNLFHSLGRFNLDAGETGLFTTSSADVQNVISRVTGGQQSTINGTLRLSALQGGTPNLFFINPSGVTLGSSAVVDVPGSFFLSTANNLAFADGTVFATSAVPNPVLTTAVPQSFGFLTNQPSKISIGRLGSLDTVRQDVTLIGGDVDVTSDGVLATNEDGFLVFPNLNIAAVASAGTVPLGFLNQNGPVDLFNNANAQANILDAPLKPELSAFSALGKVTLTGPAPQTSSATRGRIFTSLVIVSGSTTATNFLFPYGFDRIEARNDLSINQSAFFAFQDGGSQARLAADFVSLTDDQVGFVGRFDIAAQQQLRIDRSNLRGNDGIDSDLRFTSAGDLFVSDSSFGTSVSGFIEGISFSGRNVRLSNTDVSFRSDGQISLIASENLELIDGTSINATQADSITLNGRNILIADSTVDLRNAEPGGFNVAEDPVSLSIGNCTLVGCTGTDSVTLKNAQITTASIGQRFVFPNNLARSAPITISANDVFVQSSSIAASTNVRDVTCTDGPCALADDERIGDAGAITINATNRFTMTDDSSRITGSTTGRGDAGRIDITAASIDISGGTIESRNSIVAENVGKPLGAAGAITLTADQVTLGRVTISTDTVTDNPSALPASISITSRAAGLTLDGTQVSATTSSAAAAGSVALNSSGAISLLNGATIRTTTTSTGSAGNISFAAADNVSLSGTDTLVASSSSGSGTAGSIQLGTQAQRIGSLTLENGATIQASTSGAGAGGSISGSIAGEALVSGPSRISASTTGSGDAGGVSLSAARLEVSSGTIESRSTASAAGQSLGTAGSVALDADRLILGAAAISTDTASTNANAAAASITLSSRSEMRLAGTQVTATTATGTAAGLITLSNAGGAISLQDGATVATTTNSSGAAGNITITANGNVAVQSGATIRSESTATTAEAGRAGTINVTGTAITVDGGKVLASIDGGSASTATADVVLTTNTGNIDLRNGAQITVDTSGAAAGGNVSFVTPTTVSLAGAGTNVSSSSTGSGTAGSIQLGTMTQRLAGLRVTSGAAVQANTSGAGNGGAINVFVTGDAALTGAGSTLASNATDAGDGGIIMVDAANVQLANGARIESTATGSGDSGAITLNVARDLRLTDRTPESFAAQTAILTSAQQSSGGNITATVGGNLVLASSRIESSVATAAGKGGDINLLTQGLLLSSSQIFARADQGNGGGITITRRNDLAPGPFLIDANSSISAQSRAAVSGVIAIDSTDTNVTTVIDPLAAALTQVAALAANPCGSRQSGAPSTFISDSDGGVSPLPDNYFTAGVFATSPSTKIAAVSSEKITLATLMGATAGCAR